MTFRKSPLCKIIGFTFARRKAFLRLLSGGAFLMAVLAGSGCAARSTAPSSTDPRGAAADLVKHLETLDVSGLPDQKAWRVLKPRMTPELAGHFEEARRIQKNFQRRNPDEKPPWIEGDLFGSLFEGAQTYRVGEVTQRGNLAEAVVWQTYTGRGETVRWKDIYVFERTPQGWLLKDIRYGGNWPFASSGTLVEVLTSEGC